MAKMNEKSKHNDMDKNRKLHLRRYLLLAWVLKIRLMSARRQLWDAQTSLIHVENASLQMRKSCEAIAHMCMTAAEIEGTGVSAKLRNEYKIGALFKELHRKGVLRFPQPARLSQKEAFEVDRTWLLEIAPFEPADIERVGKIHGQLGQVLHDNILLKDAGRLSAAEITHLQNSLRVDHQWLWNRFWHHSFQFQEKLFFISLGDTTRTSSPTFIKEEGLLDEDLTVDFDPELIADFSFQIDWSHFA
jgi:hypothetical protein